jgi:hypothetical protein
VQSQWCAARSNQLHARQEQWGMLKTHLLRKQNDTTAERKRFTALFGIPY